MNMEERRQEIIHYLMEHNTVSVNRLIEIMQESPATIRRDLTFLEKNGYITRSRGYAKYIQPAIVHQIEISPEKIAVARAAAALIPPNATIFLDSGASSLALTQQIVNRDDITVITNSLTSANLLATTNITTYVIGGFLEGRQEALVGPEAEAYIHTMKFPLLFLTTTGVRGTQGLACVTPFQANLKHALIEASEKVVVLADAQKFETDSLRVFADFADLDVVIVDRPLSNPEQEAALKRNHVELIVADS